MKNQLLGLCFMLFYALGLGAQINPVAIGLPYAQNFGTTSFTNLPLCMATWVGTGTPAYPSLAVAEVTTGSANQLISSSTPTTSTLGGVYGHAVSGNARLTMLEAATLSPQVVLAINTTGVWTVDVNYDLVLTIPNPRTMGIALQYRVGTTGSFTTLLGSDVLYKDGTSNGGDIDGNLDTDHYSISLPAVTYNKPVVQLRWITWRGSEAGNSSGIGLDNIYIGCSSSNTLYVDSSATANGDGKTWATAYQTLDAALSAARYCSDITIIDVARGTYKPTLNPYSYGITIYSGDPSDVTFQLRSGLSLYGGFPTGGGTRNVAANPTILSGDIGVPNKRSDNAYHVVLAAFVDTTSTAVIDGFTIKDGYADGTDYHSVNGVHINQSFGAGIYTQNSRNTLRNNTVQDNRAMEGGAGVFISNSISTVINNTITKDTASYSGGGIYVSGGTATLDNNTIVRDSSQYGGGVYVGSSTVTLSNNTLINNAVYSKGGGIFIWGDYVSLINNTITNNKANLGAGISIDGGINVLNHNTITNNKALNWAGGIYNESGDNTIIHNTITGNLAKRGGGIYSYRGTSTLDSNVISNNSVSDFGGGIYLDGGINTISNNTIAANTSNNGGAGIFTDGSEDTIISNSILNNVATYYGGGICNNYGTNILRGNTILGNTAKYGGGIASGAGTNTIVNNAIANNTVSTMGGGMYINDGHNTVTNNTIVGNTSNSIAGGIYTYESSCVFANNILWANQQAGSSTVLGADYYADYYFNSTTNGNTCINNLFQLASSNYPVANLGHYAIGLTATGNIFATNPLFENIADIDGVDNIHRTSDDGLRLQAGSIAINAGAVSITTPTTDITGNIRSAAPFDLGAYEHGLGCTVGNNIYVDASANANGDGTSWTTAYQTLNAALSTAWNCSNVTVINVAAGIYKPSLKPFNNNGTNMTTTDTRDVTFHIREGLSLYGGFPAGGGVRNVAANPTILSGDIGTANSNTDNAYHVVLTSLSNTISTILLDGFTISQGYAKGIANITVNGQIISRSEGGGICTKRGVNSLINNTLTDNRADYGAGIYIGNGNTTLTNTSLVGNAASEKGGGIYIYLGTTTLTNNMLSNNTANYGAGIYTYSGANTLMNNTLSGNMAQLSGGGVYTLNGDNTLTNNILWGNQKVGSSTIQGADYYADGTNGNTFINNLLQLASSNYPLSNTGNYAIGTAATGNVFAADPLFINVADIDGLDNIHRTADDGLYLTCGSPAYNTGINTNAPALDILGNPIFATTKDRGAYESQIDISTPLATITGVMTAIDIVTLTAAGGATYAWSGGDTPNTATNTFTTSGTYTLTVTGTNNCTATASVTVTVLPNGSVSPQSFDNLNLYFVPNPAPQGNGQLMIESNVEGEAYLQVFDMYGRLIDTQKINLLQGAIRLPYQLNLTTSNMLFFHLTTKTGTIVHKVIVGL